MIGAFAEHSATFLRVFAILTLVLFSIPIALAPLTWARVLRWRVEPQSNLALYFGRCLGVFAVVLSWAAWHAASNAAVQPFYFTIFIGATTLLTVVHVVGAVQRVQPWTETAEVVFWGGLAVLGLLFYPAP